MPVFSRGMSPVPKTYYDLREVRSAIMSGQAFLAHRDKNMEALDDLGFSDEDAFAEIATLRPTQFTNTDWERGRAADVYKKKIQGQLIYIKFFMENGLVVLSFHREGDCR